MDIIMDQRNTGIKRYLIALLGIAAAVFIDQITKHLAVLYLKGNPARVIIDGVFELQYLENRGAAFGMMQNMQFVFVAGAVAICIVIFYLYIRMPNTVRYLPLRICAVPFMCGSARKYDRPYQVKLCDRFLLFQPDRFPDLQCRRLLCCHILHSFCVAYPFLLQR